MMGANINETLEEITRGIIKREFDIDPDKYVLKIFDNGMYNKSSLIFMFISEDKIKKEIEENKFSELFQEGDPIDYSENIIPRLILFIENSKQLKEMKIGILLKD